MILTPPVHVPAANELLTLCSLDYTGDVKFCGYLPGFGPHGCQLAVVQLMNDLEQPTICIDSSRLVTRSCCTSGWSRA